MMSNAMPRLLSAAIALLLLCAASIAVAAPPLRFTLDTLPEKELWAGLTIGEGKVGYSHGSLRPLGDGRYELRSEMRIFLRMLGFGKTIEFRSRDIVDRALILERFETEYRMDGNTLVLTGIRTESRLDVEIDNAGTRTRRAFPLTGKVLPATAIGIVPLLEGLVDGADYRFSVFSAESLRVAEVRQQVEAAGDGYVVHSKLQGVSDVLRLDAAGRFVSETAMGGSMRAVPLDRQAAEDYLAAAQASDQDVIVGLSLVRADRPIPMPGRLSRLRVSLEGVNLEMPSGAGQRCERAGTRWECDLDGSFREPLQGEASRWLQPSFTVTSRDDRIAALAVQLTAHSTSDEDRVGALVRWMDANIRKEGADAFTALDVLATRRAECQGHSFLYAALARAAGVPTRVVNGLVYSGDHQGFLYHTWTESLVGGEWRGIDPTFGQLSADATHIKLVEGEDPSDLGPLTDLIGRVAIRVGPYEYRR